MLTRTNFLFTLILNLSKTQRFISQNKGKSLSKIHIILNRKMKFSDRWNYQKIDPRLIYWKKWKHKTVSSTHFQPHVVTNYVKCFPVLSLYNSSFFLLLYKVYIEWRIMLLPSIFLNPSSLSPFLAISIYFNTFQTIFT